MLSWLKTEKASYCCQLLPGCLDFSAQQVDNRMSFHPWTLRLSISIQPVEAQKVFLYSVVFVVMVLPFLGVFIVKLKIACPMFGKEGLPVKLAIYLFKVCRKGLAFWKIDSVMLV